jgi:Flp pilus assembly protein protease CpaA
LLLLISFVEMFCFYSNKDANMVVCKYAKMLVTAFFLSTFLSEASGGGNVEFLSHAGLYFMRCPVGSWSR